MRSPHWEFPSNQPHCQSYGQGPPTHASKAWFIAGHMGSPMSPKLAGAAPRPDVLKYLLRNLITSSAFYLENSYTSFKASAQVSCLPMPSLTFPDRIHLAPCLLPGASLTAGQVTQPPCRAFLGCCPIMLGSSDSRAQPRPPESLGA